MRRSRELTEMTGVHVLESFGGTVISVLRTEAFVVLVLVGRLEGVVRRRVVPAVEARSITSRTRALGTGRRGDLPGFYSVLNDFSPVLKGQDSAEIFIVHVDDVGLRVLPRREKRTCRQRTIAERVRAPDRSGEPRRTYLPTP